MPHILFIGGPSGTGKSTIAEVLTKQLSVSFDVCMIEGDEYHSSENIMKMSNNIPLNDNDRWPWLKKLTELAIESSANHDFVIITCSMLKKTYRDFIKAQLVNETTSELSLVILYNTYENVLAQMKARKNHFFKESMLKSQYDTFELPDVGRESNVSIIDCHEKSPAEIAHVVESQIIH